MQIIEDKTSSEFYWQPILSRQRLEPSRWVRARKRLLEWVVYSTKNSGEVVTSGLLVMVARPCLPPLERTSLPTSTNHRSFGIHRHLLACPVENRPVMSR